MPLDSSLHAERFPLRATVTMPIKGKFTTWKKGELVMARREIGSFSIRKMHIRGSPVPLAQSCCFVPKKYLLIHAAWKIMPYPPDPL